MKKEDLIELLDLVKATKIKLKVCVPSTDYYQEKNAWSEEEIEYIDANHLISLLEDKIKEKDYHAGSLGHYNHETH